MAIFHLQVEQKGNLGSASAVAGSAYAVRLGEHAVHDDLVAAEAGNMPSWTEGDPRVFWAAIDSDSAINARLYTSMESALPVELTLLQQLELIRSFASSVADRPDGGRIPFEFGVHLKKGNPHVHINFSARVDDGLERNMEGWFKKTSKKNPEKGGARSWAEETNKAWLIATRQAWADHANAALERAGRSERIDARSHADRGIQELPTRHEGLAGQKNRDTQAHNEKVREFNAQIALKAEAPGVASTPRERQARIVREHNETLRQVATLDADRAALKAEMRAAGITIQDWREYHRDKRKAVRLHVPLDDVDATEDLIAKSDDQVAEDVPRIAGDHPVKRARLINHLQLDFISKPMRHGAGHLHIRMPVDELVFIERATSIRLRVLDRETVAAALQVGVARWQRLTLTGTIEFKRMALEEATRLGILDRVVIPPELASEFQLPQVATATGKNVMTDVDKLAFLTPLAPEIAKEVPPAQVPKAAASVADVATANLEKEKAEVHHELAVMLRGLTFGQLLDVRRPTVDPVLDTAALLNRFIQLLVRIATLGLVKTGSIANAQLVARRRLVELVEMEIAAKRTEQKTAAQRRAVEDQYQAAVRDRSARLSRRVDAAAAIKLHTSDGDDAVDAARNRAAQRAGFDRLRASRREPTVADRQAAVKAAHKAVKAVEAEVIETPGLLARAKAKEQHQAEVVARDQRLDAARKEWRAAKALLKGYELEIEAAAVQVETERAEALAAAAAATKADAAEVQRLSVEIGTFPSQLIEISAVVNQERVGRTAREIVAEAAKPVSPEDVAAAAERLRIQRDAGGRVRG